MGELKAATERGKPGHLPPGDSGRAEALGRDFDPEHFLNLGNVVEVRDLSEPEFNLKELKKQHGKDMIGRYIDYFERQDTKDEISRKALYCGLLALLEAES